MINFANFVVLENFENKFLRKFLSRKFVHANFSTFKVDVEMKNIVELKKIWSKIFIVERDRS